MIKYYFDACLIKKIEYIRTRKLQKYAYAHFIYPSKIISQKRLFTFASSVFYNKFRILFSLKKILNINYI